MKRWTDLMLVACAAGVALAQWFAPVAVEAVLGGLLFCLVVLTVVSRRAAVGQTLESLNAAHREQLESERRYRALFDACSDVILVYRFEDDGRPGQIVEVNEAACLALGYARAQLLAMTADDVLAPEARKQVRDRAQALADAGTLAYETVHITSDRQRTPVEVTARIVDIGGRRLCLTVSHSIAAHKELEEFLRGLTDVDELTGLLNRRGFFVEGRRDGAPGETRRPSGAAHVLRPRRPQAGQRRAGARGGRPAARGRRRRAPRRLPRARRGGAHRRRRVRGDGPARPAPRRACWTGRRSRRASTRRCAPSARSSATATTSR